MGREDGRIEGNRRGSADHVRPGRLPAEGRSIAGSQPVPSLVVLTTTGWLWKFADVGLGRVQRELRWSVVMPETAMPWPMAGLPGRRPWSGRPAVVA